MVEGARAGGFTPVLGSRDTAVQAVARVASIAVASVGRPSHKRRDKCVQPANTNPLASGRAKHIHADHRSNTVTYLVNKQQVQIV